MNILIINELNMGKPAATISNFHICPKTTGTVPHVGGPIAGGSGFFVGCLLHVLAINSFV